MEAVVLEIARQSPGVAALIVVVLSFNRALARANRTNRRAARLVAGLAEEVRQLAGEVRQLAARPVPAEPQE